jgi:hypothetical protein
MLRVRYFAAADSSSVPVHELGQCRWYVRTDKISGHRVLISTVCGMAQPSPENAVDFHGIRVSYVAARFF